MKKCLGPTTTQALTTTFMRAWLCYYSWANDSPGLMLNSQISNVAIISNVDICGEEQKQFLLLFFIWKLETWNSLLKLNFNFILSNFVEKSNI